MLAPPTTSQYARVSGQIAAFGSSDGPEPVRLLIQSEKPGGIMIFIVLPIKVLDAAYATARQLFVTIRSELLRGGDCPAEGVPLRTV
jgi:hypothetical protein